MILPLILSAIMNSSFCNRYLIGNDPWPYADVSTSFLIEMYQLEHNPEIRKELEQRLPPEELARLDDRP
jgi:hypothetical protein